MLIANTRQVSVLSAEELAEIAERMGLESLSPSLLRATMVIAGIPDFSHIPPGSRLQGSSGATLVVNLNTGSQHRAASRDRGRTSGLWESLQTRSRRAAWSGGVGGA